MELYIQKWKKGNLKDSMEKYKPYLKSDTQIKN